MAKSMFSEMSDITYIGFGVDLNLKWLRGLVIVGFTELRKVSVRRVFRRSGHPR